MARTKTVPAPPAMDLPMLPSDMEAAEVATTETIGDVPQSSDAMKTTETTAAVTETVAEPPTVLTSLIDRMREAESAAKRKAEADWDSLVLKLAGGEDVSEADVIAIVTAAGKSLDDLAAAVDRERELARLRAMLADYPDAEEKLTVAHTEWVAFKKRREALLKDLKAEDKRLRQAEWMASRRRDRCRDAACKLEKMTGKLIHLHCPTSVNATVTDAPTSAVA